MRHHVRIAFIYLPTVDSANLHTQIAQFKIWNAPSLCRTITVINVKRVRGRYRTLSGRTKPTWGHAAIEHDGKWSLFGYSYNYGIMYHVIQFCICRSFYIHRNVNLNRGVWCFQKHDCPSFNYVVLWSNALSDPSHKGQFQELFITCIFDVKINWVCHVQLFTLTSTMLTHKHYSGLKVIVSGEVISRWPVLSRTLRFVSSLASYSFQKSPVLM